MDAGRDEWRVPFAVEAASAALGVVLLILDGRGRKRAEQNLRVAYPDGLPPAELRRLLAAAFQNRSRPLVSRALGLPRRARARLPVPEREVLCTARVGGWQLLPEREVPGSGKGGADGQRVPFFGLPVTFPRRAVAGALAGGRGVRVALVLPAGRRRWRPWTSPDLTLDLRGLDPAESVALVLARVADVLERVIRAEPSLADWTAPWFGGRPGRALGAPGAATRWPAYSRLQA